MNISAVKSQVQIQLQKQVMNHEMVSVQNLLSGLPAPIQVPEPGKGKNVDMRA
ncbi:MAG: hypothetical protein JWN30_1111 [Bacilli bacterium]|nr:hypothetical protein [Bacilli bacterium]